MTISSALTQPGVPTAKRVLARAASSTGGLVVTAKIGGLGGGEIGLRIVSFLAVGHRQLAEAERRLGFARHRGAKDGDRFVGVRLIIGGHQRLPK